MGLTSRIVLVFCFVGLFGCHKKTSEAEGKDSAGAPKASMVMTEQAATKPLFDSLLYPGRVEAGSQAAVLAETDGLVSTLKTALGRSVQKGDVLMMIENPDPVYRYAPVAVTAPVAGVVSFLDSSVGNRVERGRKLAVIADIRAVKILVEATSNDLANLQAGQAGSMRVGDKTITAHITAISPVVDPATGTATVEMTPAKGEHLVPGVMGRVEFRVRERQGIQVPDSALVYKGTEPQLRIVEGNVAHWRAIKVGVSAGGLTEILSGVKPGEQMIVRSTSFIADGDKVEVQAARKDEVARP